MDLYGTDVCANGLYVILIRVVGVILGLSFGANRVLSAGGGGMTYDDGLGTVSLIRVDSAIEEEPQLLLLVVGLSRGHGADSAGSAQFIKGAHSCGSQHQGQ